MTKKKIVKMGRPKVAEGKARSEVLQFRVSKEELKEIWEKAKAAGKSGPIWARDIVLAASQE